MSIQLHIGGVPEHFNLPWQLAIAEGFFAKYNLLLQWHDYPEGTGAMAEALRLKKLDLAVCLTEGIVADIINGNDSLILKTYVQSPLIWGIYTTPGSPFTMNTLESARFAISRKGSGSHLMAYVHAIAQHWDTSFLQFIELKNLTGIIQGLKHQKADTFLWEKAMTQPYVDQRVLQKIGEYPSPWPCFMLVARKQTLDNYSKEVHKVLEAINAYCAVFKQKNNLIEQISERFKILPLNAKKWLDETIWPSDNHVSLQVLEMVMDTLYKLGLITHPVPASELIYSKL